MKTKHELELADVKAVAAAAEAEALKNNWAVSICIVDDGGNMLWFQRLDGAAPISAHIAPGKARTSAMGRRESKVYEDMINAGRVSFLSAPLLQGMLEGGVAIVVDGAVVGAVGVVGDRPSSAEAGRDRAHAFGPGRDDGGRDSGVVVGGQPEPHLVGSGVDHGWRDLAGRARGVVDLDDG